ncbi:uncharacterized protein LOC141697982 isoform X2 [Apium graveolens]|uniref:uncharacterized protein LOC141697982 isoform X2 n=1 Tax=Apium graveolens TaxID=4045 RepID=UPI003D7A223D
MKMEETPKTMNKKKITHAKGHKKFEEKQKEKTVESVVDVSSKQLGYPLPQDVCHDLAFVFDRVIDIQVEIGPYWNGEPWIEHINNENVPEVLNSQWLSATSIIFYIRYLCEVYLSKNPNSAQKLSFVSPHLVSQFVENSSTFLAKSLLGYVDKHHLLLMPYNIGKHWILMAINTVIETLYFMDPARMTNAAHYRHVKTLVETAMRTFRTHSGKNYTVTMTNSFRWMNVQFTYSPPLKSYHRDKMLRF